MTSLTARPTRLAVVLAGTALLALAACASGGGSSASTSAAPAGSTAPVTGAATGSAAPASSDSSTAVVPASECDPAATLVEQTEGPYYAPGAPERRDITDVSTAGSPLVLTGTVYDADCQPIAGAKIDFWQADGNGVYDNSGYGLRGYQVTDAKGRYELTTVIPGQYPGRTEHIHVKITPPGGRTITTQLYFPGSTANDSDGIFDPAMVVTVFDESGTPMRIAFDFVLP